MVCLRVPPRHHHQPYMRQRRAGLNRLSRRARRPPAVVEMPWVLPRWRNWPTPVGERRSGSAGGAESGGAHAELSLLPTPHTSWEPGLVFPFNPHKCRLGPRRWQRPHIYLWANDGWGVCTTHFLPPTRKPAVILRVGAGWGAARVALTRNERGAPHQQC
jgi:hypothetical protein